MKLSKLICLLLFTVTLNIPLSQASQIQKEEEFLNIYSWAGYLKPSVIKRFEEEFGIKVVIDFVENNMMTESKLLSQSSGYDIVGLSDSPYLSRQIRLGVFQPLNKTKLPNLNNISPKVMQLLANHDANNLHSIPFTWGTIGIGYNETMLKEIDNSANFSSLDLIFKKEQVQKFAKCGIYIDDEPAYIIPLVLSYLGRDPNSTNPEELKEVANLLHDIRPYITNIGSNENVDNLSRGDACLTLGFSGDILQSLQFSKKYSKNPLNIKYVVGSEGTEIGIDVFAITKDAKHPDNAHKFLNFLMRPEIAAANSEYNGFPSGNMKAKKFLSKEFQDHPSFNIEKALQSKYYIVREIPFRVEKLRNRTWNNFKISG